MYIDRIGEVNRRKLAPEKVGKGIEKLEDTQAADHFKNQFEVPVLFYALCNALVVTNSVTDVQYFGAWTYVVLRAIHAWIHITYNKVIHRFYVYASSTVVLYALWGLFAWKLETGQA